MLPLINLTTKATTPIIPIVDCIIPAMPYHLPFLIPIFEETTPLIENINPATIETKAVTIIAYSATLGK